MAETKLVPQMKGLRARLCRERAARMPQRDTQEFKIIDTLVKDGPPPTVEDLAIVIVEQHRQILLLQALLSEHIDEPHAAGAVAL